jgi:hypothetical protein
MFVHNNIRHFRFFSAVLLFALAGLPAAAHQAESTQPVVVNATPVTTTGTVSELTVRNQLTGVTLHYFGLKLDQGTSYALTGTGLDVLTDGARINATGTLAGNIFNVALFSVVDPAQASGRMATLGQKQTTITGTLAEIVKRLGTNGREVSLRGRIGSTAAKPPAPPSRDRLRGAFWTNPESARWSASMERLQPTDCPWTRAHHHPGAGTGRVERHRPGPCYE